MKKLSFKVYEKNRYQPQHFLSTSIASWCLEFNCTVKLTDWTLSLKLKKSGKYHCPGHKQWTELIDRKSTWWAMLLLQSLTPMTRTLHSVTVAGMFATVPMVLLHRIRSENYVLHDLLIYEPCMLWTPYSCCFNLLWQCIHVSNMMKLVVASQNIFPGVLATKMEL